MASNTSNALSTSLVTNFDVAPYYDDYDETKGYYRILSKPGYPVQGRELTQSQTMLQKQINRFGRHVFKDGSLVFQDNQNRGKFIFLKTPFVKINDLDGANNNVVLSNYLNQIVRGVTSGISARIIDYLDGSQTAANAYTKTLYVAYLDSNPSANLTTFSDGEVLISANNASLTTYSTNSTGYGLRFVINQGTIFAKEHFIEFGTLSTIIGRYNTTPSVQIGFNIAENIVDWTSDISLLDPALESSNYSAPGADRFQLKVSLAVYDANTTISSPNYFPLAVLGNGTLQQSFDDSQYAALLDYFAQRTYEQSGNFYVKGMGTSIIENLDTGSNYGFSSLGSNTKLTIIVEPGKGYCQGYPIGQLVPTYLTTDKALTYANISTQVGSTVLGNFLTCDEFVGPWNLDVATFVYFYDTPMNRSSNASTVFANPAGNIIGQARLKSIDYRSGLVGANNAQMDIYLMDIQMYGSNAFANIRSLYSGNTSPVSGADVYLKTANSVATLSDTNFTSLYYVGSDFVRTIRDTNGAVQTMFTYTATSPVSIAAAGTFTVSGISIPDELPYGTTNLTDVQKHDLILTATANAAINLAGTLTGTSACTTITGAGTAFNNLNAGDRIKFTGTSAPANTFTVSVVHSATSLDLASPLPQNITANTAQKVYLSGDGIDLTGTGYTGGVERTVAATSSSLSVDLKETFTGSFTGSLSYKITRTSAREIAKTLLPQRYVKIQCSTAGLTGPYRLGFSDVFQIRSIRINNADFATVNDGQDITSGFKFDNGQRDDYYGIATITPNPYVQLANGDYLLVCLDYFKPDFTQGIGYFSVDSYPVNDANTQSNQIRTENIPFYFSPTTGAGYNLRSYLDFRPVKTATANDTTTLVGISVNPGKSNTFYTASGTLKLPTNGDSTSYSFSYYLGRTDVVVSDSAGNYSIIQGVASQFPITPAIPDNFMGLAVVYLTPYPSLAPQYAIAISRSDLACVTTSMLNIRFTMQEIGTLKQRIENLENYVSLTLLEKSASDMQILDSNGLNRFKNGIFTDTFADDSFGDTSNPDFRISFDPTEKSIRPIFNKNSFYYNWQSTNSDPNVKYNANTDIVTLSYTEVPLISRNVATTYRNIETSTYQYDGVLNLTPDNDTWINVIQLPDNVIYANVFSNTAIYSNGYVVPVSTTWNDWTTSLTGYNIVDAVTGVVYGSFSASQTYTNPFLSTTAQIQLVPGKPATGVNNIGAQLVNNARAFNLLVPNITGQTLSAQDVAELYALAITRFGFSLNTPQALASLGLPPLTVIPPIGSSIKVQAVYSSVRTGTEAFTGSGGSSTTSLGNSLIDVSLITYMRPQTIELYAQGMKANTILYVYFDGQNMSKYVTPSRGAYVANTNVDLSLIYPYEPAGAEGSQLTSNYKGEFYGVLRIPDPSVKLFKVGTKEVTITDSPTNEPDAVTRATSYFLAQGLNESFKNTIQSTRTIIEFNNTLTQIAGNTANTIGYFPYYHSCMAYSFLVDAPSSADGLFLTSVNIYCAAKDATRGIWCEIREMDSAGGITRNAVPLSQVWLKNSQINVSADSSVPTTVTFPAPVFLMNNTQYAFIIHLDGLNPNTYFFVAKKGENDIITGQQYTARPLTGTLFTTNNNLNWDVVDGTDLKITFNRASFLGGAAQKTGVFTIGNEPIEMFYANTSTTTLSTYGEHMFGLDRLTLSGITGGTIANTDFLIGANSGANSYVINVQGSTYYMSNTGYSKGETVTAYYSSNLTPKGVTATIASYQRASGQLQSFSQFQYGNKVLIEGSSQNFIVGDTLKGQTSGQTVGIGSFAKQRYSLVDFEPTYLDFNAVSEKFEMQAISNTGSVGTYQTITPKANYQFPVDQAFYSASVEAGTYGHPSNLVRCTFSTTSDYLSPFLDLTRTSAIYVDNIINDDTTNETLASGGHLINHYISKLVTLGEGQDAEDIHVFITGYRPPNSDIQVWAKIKHREDSDSIASRPWVRLISYGNDSKYSSLADTSNFIEYAYTFPAEVMTGKNASGDPGVVQYYNSANVAFTGYKYFAIKVGLVGANNAGVINCAIVPRAADLRAIALQA